MESIEISTMSEDELDYEYQDEEINSRDVAPNSQNSNAENLQHNKDDSFDDEEDEVAVTPAIVVDSTRHGLDRRKRRSGGYVDLDNVTDADHRKVNAQRKSIHERVKITAFRRSGGTSGNSLRDEIKTSKDYVDPCVLKELFDSLDVDPDDPGLRKASVYVKGVDKLSEFEVKRIFADYSPETVQFVDESSCTVRWQSEADVVKMFLGMTKPLRRVRGPRKPEEGELLESDEEEEEVGQLKEENGEDVAVVNDITALNNKKRKRSVGKDDDFIEINIEEVKLPSGKWRIATKHVPDNRLIIVRFATGFDIRRGIINARNRPRSDEEPRLASDRDGYDYAWKTGNTRVRPGLNVFDDKGHELEWDYEHDTRFFASDSSDDDKAKNTTDDGYEHPKKSRLAQNDNDEVIREPQPPSELVVGNVQIRSRGRGARKFLAAIASDSSSSFIDVETERRNKERKHASLASDTVASNKPTRSLPKATANSPAKWTTDRHESKSDSDELEDYEDLELDVSADVIATRESCDVTELD